MMNQIAQERIEELEEEVLDCQAIMSLQEEELIELREYVKVLKAQVMSLQNAQQVDYEVA